MVEEKKEQEVKKEEVKAAPVQNAGAQGQKSGGSNVWKWVLIGCLAVIVITLLVIGGCSLMLYKTGKGVADEIQSEIEKGNIPEDIKKELEEEGIQFPDVEMPSDIDMKNMPEGLKEGPTSY